MRRVVSWIMRLMGKRTCEDIVSVIHDYYEHTLDPELEKVVERHFENCPDCEGFAQTYHALIFLTGELACEDIPEEVQRRVERALEERYRSAR